MTASITISNAPDVRYLLRIADTCLILAQRLAEWCGHGPVLEEDIALTNMALDLVGQARAVLTRAGELEGHAGGIARDEDQLAYLRDERDYLNLTLVELPGGPREGDFAVTVLRNFVMASWLKLLWQRLERSSDAEVAGIAAKAVKEARYHQQHAADWMLRLGDGTDESAARLRAALEQLWPYVAEMFDADEIDADAVRCGLGPSRAELQDGWRAEVLPVLSAARLSPPAERAFRSTGTQGRHSEHMGYILAEMQHLQRTFPGATW